MINNSLVLYILMPTDIPSMNPGKAMAQAAHAANQCVALLSTYSVESAIDLVEWKKQGKYFGTTIVLGMPYERVIDYALHAQNNEYYAGIVTDSTYPIKDGEMTHLVPFETCSWIFGRRDKVNGITVFNQKQKGNVKTYSCLSEEKLMP